MHLRDFKRAGIHIWDFWMVKMSDTDNHNESYPIPSSVDLIQLFPSKLTWYADINF